MSGPTTPRRSLAGLRHGLLLALCFVVPVALAVGAAARRYFAAFPTLVVVLLAAVVAVTAGILGVESRRTRLGRVVAGVVGAALLSLGVRLAFPTPQQAIAEVREGDAYLVSGVALATFVLLLVSAVAGKVVTGRIVSFSRGQQTAELARAEAQQLLANVGGTGLALLVLNGMTAGATGTVGQAVLVAAAVTAVVVIADLRTKVPPPGGTRPPIVAAPRSLRMAAIALATLVVLIATAVVVPLLPDVLSQGLGRPSEWVAQLDLELNPERAPVFAPEGERDQLLDRNPLGLPPPPPLPELRELLAPWWVRPALAAVLVLLLLLVLRPDRWLPILRRMWGTLRGANWDDEEGEFEALRTLDEEPDGDRGRGGRLRDVFERVRPRPRDPREAIVYDYLRVDRLLARAERGRHPSETPLEHAARVSATVPDDGFAPLTELAGLVSSARYGRAVPSAAASERSRELQQTLDRQLRARS